MIILEKILNDIDNLEKICFSSFSEPLISINDAKEIVLKYINANDGWIPVEERLPEVPEDIDDEDCPEFNVTIKGASETTTLKCDCDGIWFDDNGFVYPVIAWRPLLEPYKPQRS